MVSSVIVVDWGLKVPHKSIAGVGEGIGQMNHIATVNSEGFKGRTTALHQRCCQPNIVFVVPCQIQCQIQFSKAKAAR